MGPAAQVLMPSHPLHRQVMMMQIRLIRAYLAARFPVQGLPARLHFSSVQWSVLRIPLPDLWAFAGRGSQILWDLVGLLTLMQMEQTSTPHVMKTSNAQTTDNQVT